MKLFDNGPGKPKTRSDYYALVLSSFDGEDCWLGVRYYREYKGSYSYRAESDLDYYGFFEVDFDVLDEDGGPWPAADQAVVGDARLRDRMETEIFEELCHD